MTKEQKLRAAKVLAEFLRSEDLRLLFDEYISEATDVLTSTSPLAVNQLQDAAHQLHARKNFLLTLRRCLHDASVYDAHEKHARTTGEPN